MSRSIASFTLTASLLLGCVSQTTVHPTVPAGPVSEARFHLRDGRLFVLDDFHVQGAEIRGHGREYGVERNLVRSGPLLIQSGDLALVETTQKQLNYAVIPMAIVTGASVATTVICLANIKACFGSCPTFYVPTESGGWALQAEGFSSSIARRFEADDLDDLSDARAVDGAITVAMRNEALETHLIRSLSLQVVRGPEGSTVLRGFRDGYFAVGPSIAPEACELAGDAAAACAALASKDASELQLDSDGEGSRGPLLGHEALPRARQARRGPRAHRAQQPDEHLRALPDDGPPRPRLRRAHGRGRARRSPGDRGPGRV